MPRRFGIATIMIITAVFALLFGVLETLDVSPTAFTAISIFVAGIAVCQAVLFKGKNPRAASYVGGSVLFYLIWVVVCLTNDYGPHDLTRDFVFSVPGALISFAIGGLLGYVTGYLFAIVFLIHREPVDSPPETPATSDDNLPQT